VTDADRKRIVTGLAARYDHDSLARKEAEFFQPLRPVDSVGVIDQMHDIRSCRLGVLEGDHWLRIHGRLRAG
jgi:hypothetical protein